MNNIIKYAKVVAASVVVGVGTTGTVAISIPPDVTVPWWGYVLVSVVNIGIASIGVMYNPKATK